MSEEPRPTAPEPAALKPVELALLALAAVAARLFNLGTFSLWLDEVLLMLRAASGGPTAVWAACRANAEHPPLSALVMAAAHGLGFSETAQRLIPIALGVATVALLAVWTAHHFGRAAGLATGWITALLPFSVRYSQELRPYAYLLFFAVLTLLAAERLLRRPGATPALGLFAAAVGGLYSHVLFPLIALPMGVILGEAALTREADRRLRGRRARGYALAAGVAAFLAYLPWILPALTEISARPPGGRVKEWTWELAAKRWQFLTVGGVEGDPMTWAAWVALALTVVGVAVAWRRTAGRAALMGLLAGTVGVEIFLLSIGHWSNGRYDMMGWLFLPVLMGLGAAVLWRRPRLRPLTVVALAVLLVGEAAGLARYALAGRPHWDRVASAVQQVRRPGEPVLVENEWTRICVGYYLQGPDFQHRRREEQAPRIVPGGPASLKNLWPADRAAVLVVGRTPGRRALRRWSWAFPQVLRVPETGTRVVLLTPEVRRELAAAGEGRAGLAAADVVAGERALPPQPAPPPRWLLRLEGLGGHP